MKMIKKRISIVLALLACAAFVAFGAVHNVFADDSSVFLVNDGAEIRLENDENGEYGIRFSASVGEVRKDTSYKMMIVPTELITLYTASGSSENVVKWIKGYAQEKGGSVAESVCSPNASGVMKCAITDIYRINLNREFSAIAYYELNGNEVVATLATDGGRSIAQVANGALASGDYTEADTPSEYAALNEIKAAAEQQKNNVLIGSDDKLGFIDFNTAYCTGKIEHTEIDGRGSAWKIVYESKTGDHAELKLDKDLSDARIKGYDTIKFSVYNAGADGGQALYLSRGTGLSGNKTYPYGAKSWQSITISASDFADCGYITFPFTALNTEYYITDVKAYTASEMAAQAIAEIESLPEKTEITPFAGGKISEARAAYDALSDKAKSLVNNYDKLVSLEAEYKRNYVVVDGISSSANFTLNVDYTKSEQVDIDVKEDAAYGKYLSVVYKKSDGDFVHIALTYKNGDLTKMLVGCEKVWLGIYNGGTTNKAMLTNIGGFNANYAKLKAGEWTFVSFGAADFVTGKYLGVIGAESGAEYKFSMIYATTSDGEAMSVEKMIKALPDETEYSVLSDYDRVLAAKAAYNGLSTAAQDLVSSDSKAKLSALDGKYVVINDMTSVAGFTVNNEGYGNGGCTDFDIGKDEEFGKYLSATITNPTHEHLVIKYTKASDLENLLANCDKVYFYAYNGGERDRWLLANFGGDLKPEFVNLKSKSWTKIEIAKEDFIKGSYFGIYGAQYQSTNPCEYRFSMIYATKA